MNICNTLYHYAEQVRGRRKIDFIKLNITVKLALRGEEGASWVKKKNRKSQRKGKKKQELIFK